MAAPYFSRATFAFLKDLAANNDREWFQANKPRYEEHVRQPALRFIGDFGPHVRAVSPHLVCDPRPQGGSLFRIHRDIRFSRDKSPYKNHAAMQFRHESGPGNAHAPGLYLHLEPGASGLAAGVWRPATPELRVIREAVAARPGVWAAACAAAVTPPAQRFGEKLQRVPAGYAKDHPAAEELKWKDWGVWQPLSQQDIVAGDAMQRLGSAFLRMKPVMAFLCEAMELPF